MICNSICSNSTFWFSSSNINNTFYNYSNIIIIVIIIIIIVISISLGKPGAFFYYKNHNFSSFCLFVFTPNVLQFLLFFYIYFYLNVDDEIYFLFIVVLLLIVLN